MKDCWKIFPLVTTMLLSAVHSPCTTVRQQHTGGFRAQVGVAGARRVSISDTSSTTTDRRNWSARTAVSCLLTAGILTRGRTRPSFRW